MISLLNEKFPDLIPDPLHADSSGMVAVSKTLGVERLVSAYKKGIFPWMKMEEYPNYWCWFSPDPRMVLRPQQLKVSRSLKKAISDKRFEIRIDCSFRETMQSCARSSRPGQETTWIEPEMIDDYEKLHQMGIAHSIEAWQEGKQVGGLYGLAFGKMFFGESMFHQVPEASKVCLAHLANLSQKYGIEMIDCQAHTPHLEKMGAREIPRNQFCTDLSRFLQNKESVIPWQELSKSSILAGSSEN